MNRTRIILILFMAVAIISGVYWAKGRGAKESMKAAVEAQQKAKPALWAVRDADTTIYLFGSVHMLPKGIEWLEGPVANAVNTSDALVMEIAGADADVIASHDIAKMPYDTKVEPLLLRIDPAWRRRVQTDIDASTLKRYDSMESWAVALDLNRQALEKSGFSSNAGVETVIAPFFRSKGKPVTGLETALFQMQMINDLTGEAQSTMLNDAIAKRADAGSRVKKLVTAWADGDMAALEKSFADDLEGMPGVREQIITKRNKNWAAWIDERMDQPGTILVVVGAGHLIGADSVQSMIKPMGHESQRIQ